MPNQDIKQKIGEAFYSDPAKLVGSSWKVAYGRRKECPEHLVTDGHTSKKKRGTFISPKSPLYMHDVSTNEGCSCIDWVMREKGFGYWDAVREISRVYGFYIPDTYRKETPEQKARRERRKAQETAVISMKPTPQQEGTPLGEEEAYLLGRGITREMQAEWHIGCLSADPAKGALYANFKAVEGILIERSRWNTAKDVAAIGVGSLYTIAIPEFTAGRLTGIVFTAPRARTDAATAAGRNAPKYWPVPLDIDDPERVRLFGLCGARGNTPLPVLIVVEGTMDAITASEALKGSGFPDVVATNTSHISEKQAEAIHAAGYRAVIIAADYEGKKPERDTAGTIKDEKGNAICTVSAGLEQRAGFVRLSAEALRDFGIVAAVADMQDDNPETKSDAADLIKARGAQEFLYRIKVARPASSFAAADIYNAARLRSGREMPAIPLAQLSAALSQVVAEEDNEQLRAQLLADLAPIAGGEAAAINAVQEARERVQNSRVERAKAREWAKAKVVREKAAKLIVEGKEEEAFKVLQEGKKDALALDAEAIAFAPQGKAIYEAEAPDKGAMEMPWKLRDQNGNTYPVTIPTEAVSVLAAKSGHGKTTALLNVAARTCYKDNGSTIFFTIEKNRRRVHARFVSVLAGIYGMPYEQAEAEAEKVISARRLLFFKESEIGRIAAICHAVNKVDPVAFVVIDYVQLLQLQGHRGNKKERMEEVCLRLRNLAIDTGTAVVLGAQLNAVTPNPVDWSADNIGDAVDIGQVAEETYLIWDAQNKPLKGGYTGVSEACQAVEGVLHQYGCPSWKFGNKGQLFIQLAKTKTDTPLNACGVFAEDAGGAILNSK